MAGNNDLNVALRITGDASGVSAAAKQAQDDLAGIGTSAQQAGSQASAGFGNAEAAIQRLAQRAQESASSVSAALSAVDKYGGSFAALERLAADEDLVTSAFKRGTISAEQHAAAIAGIGAKRSALKEIEDAATKTGGAFAHLQFQTAGVTQEVSRLGSEALRGNFVRMESSGIVLAQRMGLLGLAFSGVGVAIIGAAAATVGLIGLWVQGANEVDSFNRGLIATGGYAGVSTQQLVSLTSAIGQVTGHFGDARTAMQAIAASGKFTADELSAAGQGAVQFAELTGTSIEKAVGVFEKLTQEPAKFSRELNQSFHYLTPEIYAQIAALEEEGNKIDAGSVALKAFFDVMNQRHAEYVQSLGMFSVAWRGLKAEVGHAADEVERFLNSSKAAPAAQAAIFTLAGGLLGSVLSPRIYDETAAAQKRFSAATTEAAKSAAADAAARKAEEQAVSDFAVSAVADFSKLDESIKRQIATRGQSHEAIAQEAVVQKLAAAETQFAGAALETEREKIVAASGAVLAHAAALDRQEAAQKAATKSAAELAKEENELTTLQSRGLSLVDQLTAGNNREQAAQRELTNSLALANDLEAHAIDLYQRKQISLEKYTAALKLSADITELATQKDKNLVDVEEKLKALHLETGSALDQLLNKWRDEEADITQLGDNYERLRAEKQATKEIDEAYARTLESLKNATSDEIDAAEREYRATRNSAAAHADYMHLLKQERGVIDEWAQAAEQDFNSAFQAINKDIIEGGSVMKDLTNIAKQVVEQIIFEFEKLAIINPLLNSLFGGDRPGLSTGSGALALLGQNGSPLGSILNLFSGSGSSGAGASAFAGSQAQATVGNITATGAGGGGILGNLGSLGSLGNLFSGAGTLGGNLWSRFTGGYGYDGGVMTGPSYELSNDFVGPPSALAGPGVPGYGGYGSALGQGIGILGGAYAGYNEFKNAGGGVAGAAGGAAYGVGTYFAGAGVSAALAGGVSAGLAAIPVVGWIALAAMLIDKFSGGKLFGTAYQTKSAEVDLSVGAAGGEASTLLHQEGQKVLFGGTKRRTKSIASSQDAIDAANALYDEIKQIGEQAAQAIDVAVPPIIDASINTITEYDKKGHVKSTKILVEAFGKQWEEATQELAQKRLAADEIIATVAASSIGKNAQQIADQWQGSAEKLADGAALLLGATADINSGKGLLGANATLEETVKVTQKLEGAGESLVQTYSRLVTETDAVKEAFDLAGTTMRQTGADAVQYADDATKKLKGKSLAEFFADYYSPSEMAARQADVLKPQVAKDLAAIGLGPDTTMAEFKAAYTAAMKSGLSAEDLAKWIDAGIDLADFTKAMQAAGQSSETSAQQIEQGTKQYDAFMAPFRRAVDGLDDFTHVINDMAAPLQNTIEQAETLAKAAGMQGASAQDISAIIQVATQQGVAAFQQLEKNAQQLASNLYGTSFIDGLKKQLADSEAFGISRPDLQKKIDQAQGNVEAQQQGQRLIDAQQLAREVAEIAAFNGGSIDDILKKLGIPLDAFSGDLKLQGQSVEAYIGKLEDQAKMQLHIADDTAKMPPLLADILAAIRGEPLPYQDASRFLPSDTPQQAAALGKPSRGTVGAPGVSVGPAAPAPTGGSDSPNTGGDTAPIVPNRDGNRVGVVPRQLISGPTTSTAAPSADATLGDGIRKLIDVNHDGLGDVKDLLTAVVAALNTIAAKTGSQTPTVAGHRILPQPVPTR